MKFRKKQPNGCYWCGMELTIGWMSKESQKEPFYNICEVCMLHDKKAIEFFMDMEFQDRIPSDSKVFKYKDKTS